MQEHPGEALDWLMTRLKITDNDLARDLGVAHSTVVRWRHGTHRPSMKLAMVTVRLLGGKMGRRLEVSELWDPGNLSFKNVACGSKQWT